MNATDRALQVLLNNKLLDVACYTPVGTYGEVDLDTGEVVKKYTIHLLEGAILNNKEVRSFIRDGIIVNANTTWLLTDQAVTTDDRLVIYSTIYDVKQVINSFYGKWHLLQLERLVGEEIFQPEVKLFKCSDTVKVFLDMLVLDVKNQYNWDLPTDLVIFPVAGFTLEDSLRRLYPLDTFAETSGEVFYVEMGRRSGYSGLGTVDGQYARKAIEMVQTNKVELYPYVASFNERMGRL